MSSSRGNKGPAPPARTAVPLQAKGAREGEDASAAQGKKKHLRCAVPQSRGDKGPAPPARAAVPLQAKGAREGEDASAAQGVLYLPKNFSISPASESG